MSLLRVRSYLLGIAISTMALVGCGAPASTLDGAFPSIARIGTNAPMSFARTYRNVLDVLLPVPLDVKTRHDYRRSWISPAAKYARDIYFAGDATYDTVRMLRLPDMKLLGTLTGFHGPGGMCSDDKGNVYITTGEQDQVSEVAEYSHTGVLLNSYKDPYGSPTSCAVNPINGDLAVTNNKIGQYNYGGEVLIYSSPSSPPKFRRNPAQMTYSFAGYDSAGDLWVDGFTFYYGQFIVSSCSSKGCKTIHTTGRTIYFAGAVQWDDHARAWIIFDQMCNGDYSACSYPVSSQGVVSSPTMYSNYRGGPACDITQGVIGRGDFAVSSDLEYCGYAKTSFARWNYPSGGKPTSYSIDRESDAFPIGAAISSAK